MDADAGWGKRSALEPSSSFGRRCTTRHPRTINCAGPKTGRPGNRKPKKVNEFRSRGKKRGAKKTKGGSDQTLTRQSPIEGPLSGYLKGGRSKGIHGKLQCTMWNGWKKRKALVEGLNVERIGI